LKKPKRRRLRRPGGFPYRWRSRQTNGERYGQRLRVVQYFQNANALVEFDDGERLLANKMQFRSADSVILKPTKGKKHV
jgi:hypothetical protein